MLPPSHNASGLCRSGYEEIVRQCDCRLLYYCRCSALKRRQLRIPARLYANRRTLHSPMSEGLGVCVRTYVSACFRNVFLGVASKPDPGGRGRDARCRLALFRVVLTQYTRDRRENKRASLLWVFLKGTLAGTIVFRSCRVLLCCILQT